MVKKLISYDDEAEGLGLPDVVEGKLAEVFAPIGDYAPASGSTVYATKDEIAAVPDNVVTSPHGLNLRLTDDPGFVGQEGDLVFFFEPTTHYVDLGATGLTDLTPRYRESPGWVEQDGYIRHNPGSGVAKAFQSVDVLDAEPDATDVEIVAKLRTDQLGAGYAPGVIVRGKGDATTGSALILTLSINGLHLGAYVNGGWVEYNAHSVSIPAGQWVWLRLRAIGDQATGRWWIDGDPEPSDWQVSRTLTAPELLTTGWAGLQTSSLGGHDFAAVGVALDGATAPVAP